MKINYIFIALLGINILSANAIAETKLEAFKQLDQDVQKLKNNQNNLTAQERANEVDKIFNKLESNTSEEDKLVVSILKEEVNKFSAKIVEYDKFLNRIAAPEFFNMDNAQDPVKLDQQIQTAKDYESTSQRMTELAKNMPETIAAALKAKNIGDKQITSTLNGLKESEAQSTRTPVIIFSARTEHAKVLLKGLEYLKSWKGKWRYDTKEGLLKFKDIAESTIWEKEILDPLNKIELSLAG